MYYYDTFYLFLWKNLEHKNMMFTILIESFSGQLLMLTCIYLLVLVVIFLDLWSGIRKARQRGEFRSSYGLRKTVEKIAKYFNMLFVITIIDVIQMLAIYHLNPQVSFRLPTMPILTFLGAIFVGFIELKSIYEKAEDKDKGKYQDAAKLAGKIIADKNAVEALTQLFNYLKTENKSFQKDEKN